MPGLLSMDWPMKLQRRLSNEKPRPSKKDIIAPKLDKKAVAASVEPFSLKIRIESPPLVAYGPPDASSGALLSGILDLYSRPPFNPNDKTFEVAKLEMKLVMTITTRRPIGHNCPACANKTKILHTWVFIPSRQTLPYQSGAPHGFPFSFLLPGDLPATTRSSLASVSYSLIAEAVPVQAQPTPTSSPKPTPTSSPQMGPTIGRPSPKHSNSFKPSVPNQPLNFSRSILPNPEPKHSHRIFPPTTLSAVATMPQVLYPGSTDNEVDVTLSGLNISEGSKLRWSLRKLSWRIDEVAKVVSSACPLHASKVGAEGKGILYEDTRIVGAGEIKQGWKNDLDAGKIECILKIGTVPRAMAACNLDTISGIHVAHNLVIEIIVAEELLHVAMGPAKKGGQFQPTGNARVLRMTFPILLTERGGMGISWDEEIPPRYEDVAWNSPPTFAQSEGSSDASDRGSMEDIETLEGIRRPTPSGFHRLSSTSLVRPSSASTTSSTHSRPSSDLSEA
jgi:arrestin-related trafficking adapter 1